MLRIRSRVPFVTPIFDREDEHVGWVSGDWESILDTNMRWVGYIDRR
jgi:4-fold beta flower protein